MVLLQNDDMNSVFAHMLAGMFFFPPEVTHNFIIGATLASLLIYLLESEYMLPSIKKWEDLRGQFYFNLGMTFLEISKLIN